MNLQKTAAGQQEQQQSSKSQQFEQAFFQLAYEKLQEKLYNLLPFLVGFEIVNKNDEGTKALGVFGFKSENDQIIYVPAFFINGTVKGVDIMYSKNNEQFYPLNEDFAELFLKDDATGMGTASKDSAKTIKQQMQPVDLKDLVRPPRTGKVSFASVLDFVEEADDLTKQAFYNLFTENDNFMDSVLSFYPIEKVAKAVAPKKKEQKVLPLPSVSVIYMSSMVSGLPEKDVEAILTKGYVIVDNRKDEEISKFGLIKYNETFTNPTDSGFYVYLTRDGALRYALILTKPQRLDLNFSTDDALIIDLDASEAGQGYIEKVTNIFTKGKYTVKDFEGVHELMEEPAEISPSFSESYVLINGKLQCTVPFRVIANFKDHDGQRRIRVEKDYSCCNEIGKSPNKEFTLVMTKRPGNKLEYKGNTIYVPKGFKLLNVNFHPPIGGMGSPERQRYDIGKPGGLSSLTGSLHERAIFPLSVKSNGSEYFVNIGSVKKKYDNSLKAKIGMVLDLGMLEKDAEDLIDSVPNMGTKEGTIKLAVTGDMYHSLTDPTPYTNELGQPTYDGVGYSEVQQPGDGYQKDPTQMGLAETKMPDAMEDSGPGLNAALQYSTQLAQAGQKEIFDTHSIATLAKYVSPQSKVNSYMPDYISCLDKLGRMLFLTYWDTQKFEEMYSREEIPELIELLTNVFKNLGDLVIFFKRRSPEVSINMTDDQLAV